MNKSNNNNNNNNLNSGHLRVLKIFSIIERCTLFGGDLKKTVILGTKCFVRYSWHVRYLECPLLGGLIVLHIALHGISSY